MNNVPQKIEKFMVEQILIQGYRHLLGDPMFESEPFYTLNIGDKVSRIGDGRNTSTHRTFDVSPYMTYVGSYVASDGEKYYCFKLPEDGVSGWSLFRQKTDVYACFVDVKGLVGQHNDRILNLFCYVPQFKLVL